MGTEEKKEQSRFELYIRPIRETGVPDNTVAYFTQARLLDPELGVLLPDVFMPVAEKAQKATDILNWSVKKAISVMNRFEKNGISYGYFAFYCPEHFFADNKAVDNFLQTIASLEKPIELGKFAFCFYPQTTVSKDETVLLNMLKLKEKGVRLIISGYGCEGFPTSALLKMPADFLIPDKLIFDCLKGSEQEKQYAEGILDMAKRLGIKIIASDICTQDDLNLASDYCEYAMGDFLGKFKSDRYTRS